MKGIDTQELGMSDTTITLKHLCNAITNNDAARCRLILLPMSAAEIAASVNAKVKTRPPVSPVHLAAEADVSIDIWKLLLPWADIKTVCTGKRPPVFRLVYKYSRRGPHERSRIYSTLPLRQLKKLMCLLEKTKTSSDKTCQRCKTEVLCYLCRLQGGTSSGDASLEDIRNLAKDMIETYDTTVCLEDTDCPIHWAMECDNLCLLSLLLSYETANPNCLMDGESTPLSIHFSFGKRVFYLPCIGLLLENGARLAEEDKYTGVKAFHKVLLHLTPAELESFMKKFCQSLKTSAAGSMPLPLIHGLLLYALPFSPYKNDSQKMESDILIKIKILRKFGILLDLCDIHGRTILHYACWLKYSKLVEYLLSVGLNASDTDYFGRGCIYYAISEPIRNYAALIENKMPLLTLNKVINAQGVPATTMFDNLGRSALHFACFNGSASAVEYLLNLDCPIQIEDHNGKTALEYAKDRCADKIKKFQALSMQSVTKVTKSPIYGSDYIDSTTHSQQISVKRTETENVICDNANSTERKVKEDNNSKAVSGTMVKERPYAIVYERRNYSSGTMVKERPYAIEYERKKYSREMNTGRHKSINGVLNDPKYGALEDNEVRHIIKDMHHLIKRLTENLAETEPRFLAKVELAGSTSEGTKLKPPDEFDFQFHLKVISDCYVIEELKSGNDVSLGIKSSHHIKMINDMIQSGVSLNKKLFNTFHSAVYKVLLKETFWKDLPFYWHSHNFVISAANKRAYSKGALTAPLRLKWVGSQEADIDISVDLVPVTVMKNLPTDILKMIPDEVTEFVDKIDFNWYVVCRDSKEGRLSFFPVERWILCRLMPEVRRAYTFAKAVSKYCCETFGFDSDFITSYMLKNALFYELDPYLRYGLLKNQMMPLDSVNLCHRLILKLLTESMFKAKADKEEFIQSWAWKIFNRLEKWFSKDDDAVHVYCRPSETFPEIVVLQLDKENPYLRSLRKFQEVTSTMTTTNVN